MSEVDIGGVVRQFRLARGITLQELAQRTNLSQSFLSRVERNLVDPSVKTLVAVARALDVAPAIFLQGPQAADDDRVRIVRGSERDTRYLQDGRVRIDTLAVSPERSAMLDMSLHTYEQGAHMPIQSSRNEFDEIFLFVQQGQVAVWVESRQYEMQAGDSLCFPGDRPHRWWNSGEGVAVLQVCKVRHE